MGRRIRPPLFAAERAKRDAELAARKESIRQSASSMPGTSGF
jgi:hypothetical protein